MNEKIRQLMDECGTYIDPHNIEVTRKEIEFLCEQIVRECAGIAYRSGDDGDCYANSILYEFNIDNCRSDA